MALIEICVNDIKGALLAEKYGADRIEFCNNLYEGGTTPSMGAIKFCIKEISIPCFPIIRCRGGNFEYSSEEKKVMLHDIDLLLDLGVQGLVIGALKQSQIDVEFISQILEKTQGIDITFHKAFDHIEGHLLQNLKQIQKLGINRILTSGNSKNCIEGQSTIKEMIASDLMTILPGGGLNPSNIAEFLSFTHATEVHASLTNMTMVDNFKQIYTEEEALKKFVKIIKSRI